MDSVTQAALGATVGALVAGPHVPRKALLLGAVAGTLPDLDVFYNFFTDDVGRLVSHRSVTHSLIIAPFVAYGLSRLAVRLKWLPLSKQRWFWLFFWCFITHILLDWMTIYGTQIFYPFSRYPFALSSMFIIDPFYTVPLLFAISWFCLSRVAAVKRHRILIVAMVLTTAYLLASVVGKNYAEHQFKQALAEQQIVYQKLETINAPFNIFLWRVVVVSEEANISGWYSLISPRNPIQFTSVSKHLERASLDALAERSKALSDLIYFSKGFYRYEDGAEGIEWIDLRFGIAGFYPFRYLVARNEAGVLHLPAQIRQARAARQRPSLGEIFREVWQQL